MAWTLAKPMIAAVSLGMIFAFLAIEPDSYATQRFMEEAKVFLVNAAIMSLFLAAAGAVLGCWILEELSLFPWVVCYVRKGKTAWIDRKLYSQRQAECCAEYNSGRLPRSDVTCRADRLFRWKLN
jgi:cytochrome bd-type quinol oxidase subunit 1